MPGMTKAKAAKLGVDRLADARAKKIAYWNNEAERRGKTLRRSTPGNTTLIWKLFDEEVAEARKIGPSMIETLRAICYTAAAKFAGQSTASGQRFYRQGLKMGVVNPPYEEAGGAGEAPAPPPPT